MPAARFKWDYRLSLDEHPGTSVAARRSTLGSETAMPLEQTIEDSPRQRFLKSSRLALGGAVLGAALIGLGTRVTGTNDSTLVDLVGAIAGAGAVTVALLTGHYAHRR